MKKEEINYEQSNEEIMSPRQFMERNSIYKNPTIEGFIAYGDDPNIILFGYARYKCPALQIPIESIEAIRAGRMYPCFNMSNEKASNQMWQATVFLKSPDNKPAQMFMNLLQELKNVQSSSNSYFVNNDDCGCTANSSKPAIKNNIPSCPPGCRPHLRCCGPYPDICSETCWDCDCPYTTYERNTRKKHCTMWFGVEACPDFRWRRCTYDGIKWWTEEQGSCYTDNNENPKNNWPFGANFKERVTGKQMGYSEPPSISAPATSATVSYPEGTDPHDE